MLAYGHDVENLVESIASKLPLKSTAGERVVNPKIKTNGRPGAMVPRKGLEPSRL
jgi:hypothetical protein